MKKSIKTILAAVAALSCVSAFAFAGCGNNGDMLTKEPNVGIEQGVAEEVGGYASVAYYESERPEDVKIRFETDKIQKVSFKYRVLNSNEYSFRNDTLTIKKSVFKNETAGNKRLRVFVGGMYTEITVRVVTKVIYTTEDFNSIRTNLNGVYVLGADIDFGGDMFNPIGKSVDKNGATGIFEGIFDGMGHSVKNVVIQTHDYSEGEDGQGQGPSLGSQNDNGRNYNNGIFMTTGGSAQIINTQFVNISLHCRGLGGAVVGANGGLIKNCRVTCSLSAQNYSEHAGGIAGINGSGDAAGKIENCVVVYSQAGAVSPRGIADQNVGIISNCYAAVIDDYVLHMGYDKETGKISVDFDYDEYITQDNFTDALGNFTIPAFPGALSWVNGELVYYKGGDIINSDVVRKEFLLDPANFPESDGWDTSIWSFSYGAYPTLKIQSR